MEINQENVENKHDQNNEGKDDRTENISDDHKRHSSDLPAVTPNMVYGPKESRRMLKNIFLISFSFTFLFTAYQSMANLQSSLNTVRNNFVILSDMT